MGDPKDVAVEALLQAQNLTIQGLKDEIERLRWWLQHIYNGRTCPAGDAAEDLREMAYYALEGDFAGPGAP